MTMSGDRAARPVAAPGTSAPAAPTSARDDRAPARPPWWCAHRSRSSAVGVLVTAALVCLAAGVAVVGFVSVGSTTAALVALFVLAVGAANVVSGSFGAAWWARRVPPSEEVTSMNSTDDRRRLAADGPLPRRPTPVVPAARGGRHAAPPAPGDEPTTRIPASPGPAGSPPPAPPSSAPGAAEGLRPVATVGPPPPPLPPGGPSAPGGRLSGAPSPSDPTEALPAQNPDAETELVAESPGPTTVRAAARRAAARPTSRARRVAGHQR